MIFWFSVRQRIPLTRAAAEEPVEVVEAPADGPAVERSGRALLGVRRQVPLAERRGAVPVVAQDPRERDAVVGDERRIACEPGRELADRAEADRVAVAAGEQRGSRRRAERRDVEAVVADALLRHARVVGCIDRAAEGSGVAEPGIVDQHQQDVRSAVGGIDLAERRPIRLRALQGPVRHTRERPFADRELRSIGLAHQVASVRPAVAGRAGLKGLRTRFHGSASPSSPNRDHLEPVRSPAAHFRPGSAGAGPPALGARSSGPTRPAPVRSLIGGCSCSSGRDHCSSSGASSAASTS